MQSGRKGGHKYHKHQDYDSDLAIFVFDNPQKFVLVLGMLVLFGPASFVIEISGIKGRCFYSNDDVCRALFDK